ncbi:MAG TPA: aquaporin Z [Candidatus Angelobacter sp.]|nr:aquaporin Z [Candidatus Angelobacter sp.]
MKYTAELFGTFVLVFAGLGAAVLSGSQIGIVGIAMAFGLALLAMAYAVGPVSGCHINPAVSLGMMLTKRMSVGEMVGYWVAQVIGGIIGGALVLFIASQAQGGYSAAASGFAANGYGAHSPGHYSLAAAFVVEMLCTTLLVATVLGATDKRTPAGFAGVPIGFILVAIHFAGVPVTNGSFNPVRSIAPAVFVGGWALQQLWLFIAAPLAGGVLASIIYMAIAAPKPATQAAAASR